ncbi:MAG: hypothetical protein HC806_00940 [Anaerolineae bacterium]|nr:hypothetical protein [Anaerolineae bacterium]
MDLSGVTFTLPSRVMWTGRSFESNELEQAISETETRLQDWLSAFPRTSEKLQPLLASAAGGENTFFLVFGRGLREWQTRYQWWQVKTQLQGMPREQMDQLESLIRRRQTLQRQVASLAIARRLLALWHTVHIPIGMALFCSHSTYCWGNILRDLTPITEEADEVSGYTNLHEFT